MPQASEFCVVVLRIAASSHDAIVALSTHHTEFGVHTLCLLRGSTGPVRHGIESKVVCQGQNSVSDSGQGC